VIAVDRSELRFLDMQMAKKISMKRRANSGFITRRVMKITLEQPSVFCLLFLAMQKSKKAIDET